MNQHFQLTKKQEEAKTAFEFNEALKADAEYMRIQRERESERKARMKILNDEEKPLVDELKSAGHDVESAWDFVNTNENYYDVLPVLIKHLQLPYLDRNKEGIVRSLIMKEFRGVAGPYVLAELKKFENFNTEIKCSSRSVPQELKKFEKIDRSNLISVFLSALQCLADRSMTADLEAMLDDEKYAPIRDVIEKAIRKSKKK